MIKYNIRLILNINTCNMRKRYTPEKVYLLVGRKIFGKKTCKIGTLKHKLLTEIGLLEEISLR